HRQLRRQQLQEVTFSDLKPHEEKQLHTLDTYFENEAAEAFNVGGKKITPKLIADALHSLPEDKRKAVLLYYFMEMSDVEISELLDIPRSTVQYRRTSSFELLKRYLEEHADEWDC
ncbi:RNA polymerase subunit sigma, partial [Christensenellaceae bacterium OttesenSCG-928-M15]|nr:RNA polymerase subunit sigma [Christensenellaceae bacterium OttesenSCG-928-M15]